MDPIWKILIISGLVSVAIFLQILACFAFKDPESGAQGNWRASGFNRNPRVGTSTPEC